MIKNCVFVVILAILAIRPKSRHFALHARIVGLCHLCHRTQYSSLEVVGVRWGVTWGSFRARSSVVVVDFGGRWGVVWGSFGTRSSVSCDSLCGLALALRQKITQ